MVTLLKSKNIVSIRHSMQRCHSNKTTTNSSFVFILQRSVDQKFLGGEKERKC